MSEKKERIKYNNTLLEKCIKRDKSTLKGEYDKLDYTQVIFFICVCGKEHKKTFKQIYKAGSYCKECTEEKKCVKTKVTNIKKYGVEHSLKLKEYKDKAKDTCLKKYGVEYPIQSKNIRLKSEETNLIKYGVKNVFQDENIKDKIKHTNFKKGTK